MIFLTLLFPFFGLMLSLFHWRESWAKNVFWVVCVYMGAVYIFNIDGADSQGFARDLAAMYYQNLDFSTILRTLFRDGGVTVDIYGPTLLMLVSRFTDNGHMLFAVEAFIVGYFLSRNIWYVLERLPDSTGGWELALIGIFILSWPISRIGGIRFVLATHVFVYGALPYLFEGEKKKLIWCFLSALIHFSFIFAIIILIIYVFLPHKSITPLFFFYIATIFINTINLTSLNGVLSGILPDIFSYRVDAYTDENYAEKLLQKAAEDGAIHIAIAEFLRKWVMFTYVVLGYFHIMRYHKHDDIFVRLFTFSLLIYGFSNIFALVPSGSRFVRVSQMFMTPSLLLLVTDPVRFSPLKKNHHLLALFLSYVLLIDLWVELNTFGWTLFFGNFITLFFVDTNVPFSMWFKQII